MKCGNSFEEFKLLNGISVEDMVFVFESILEAFPMIVLGNLTQNTYMMVKDDGFLADETPKYGIYDELISYGVENIHPNYRKVFLDNFSRDRLLESFAQGKREVFAKLYQKGRGHNYQWVSTHVIRITDHNGDVYEVCINKILEPESGFEFHRYSGEPIG